jgi:hypothetical protein
VQLLQGKVFRLAAAKSAHFSRFASHAFPCHSLEPLAEGEKKEGWWDRGCPPNMKNITNIQDLVDELVSQQGQDVQVQCLRACTMWQNTEQGVNLSLS